MISALVLLLPGIQCCAHEQASASSCCRYSWAILQRLATSEVVYLTYRKPILAEWGHKAGKRPDAWEGVAFCWQHSKDTGLHACCCQTAEEDCLYSGKMFPALLLPKVNARMDHWKDGPLGQYCCWKVGGLKGLQKALLKGHQEWPRTAGRRCG